MLERIERNDMSDESIPIGQTRGIPIGFSEGISLHGVLPSLYHAGGGVCSNSLIQIYRNASGLIFGDGGYGIRTKGTA
jgi:hypothetical protein